MFEILPGLSIPRGFRGAISSLLLTAALLLAVSASRAQAPATGSDSAPNVPGTSIDAPRTPTASVPAVIQAYTLPPDKLEKANHLAHIRTFLHFTYAIWGIIFLILWLAWRGNSRLRNVSKNLSNKRGVQGLIYIPLFLLILTLSSLPLDIYGHHLQLSYGFSVQHWGSWFGDWAKSLGITLLVGTFCIMVAYVAIRRSPRFWWFLLWLATIPFFIVTVFLIPVIIDPIFNHFEPLTRSNAALVDQLERVVARTGTDIPPDRMFLMKASEKVTTLNAYVTGLGATKRVVVWDTTIAKAPTDDILFIFGHESGHYVLNHIYLGMALSIVEYFFLLWLACYVVRWLLRRYGEQWRVSGLEDWSSLAVLVLIFSVFGFLTEPLENTASRYMEHQADVYGQEAIHGIVADPQAGATHGFQILGELSLSDPNPNPIVEFWTYNHPSIGDRVRFAAGYNPWAPGQQPEFFKPK